MNLAHLHLLLNHLPTIGFAIGLGLFIVALFAKSEDLKRASLGIFFLMALFSIPAYLTGNAAYEAIMESPGVSERTVRAHEDAALMAFVVMELVGFLSWIGLWQYRRTPKLPGWTLPAILILSIVTFGLMARAATLGGEIRHPEINPEAQVAGEAIPTPESATGEEEEIASTARSLGEAITLNAWVWPAAETLHFVGLCLLFGVVLIVDLRILGMAKSVSFATLYQLLPVGMLGFTINLITGMMFFLSTPEQYTANVSFHWKIILLVLAGINVLYFMLFDEAWSVGAGDEAPWTAKVVAASGICLWAGVLYFGHMLPFLGNAF
jgi:uncharacterized membrane protein